MISVEFIPNIGSKRNLHWAVAGRYPWILCCCIPSHIFLWNRCWQPKDKENDCKCVVNDSMEDTRSHFQASSRIHSYMLSQRKNESKEEWILKKIHIPKRIAWSMNRMWRLPRPKGNPCIIQSQTNLESRTKRERESISEIGRLVLDQRLGKSDRNDRDL